MNYLSINDGVVTNVTLGFDPTAQLSIPHDGSDVWMDWTTTDGGETFIAPEPPEAPPAPPALPKNITPLQAIGLCQSAGGMTDALLVAADGNANLAAAWIKFRFAQEVERDNALTLEFLDALHALGYMPNGKDAVIAAWPTV